MTAEGRKRRISARQKTNYSATKRSFLQPACLPHSRQVILGLLFLFPPFAGLAMIQQTQEADYATLRYAGMPCDAITRLQTRIDNGQVTLAYDAQRGYLPAVLAALHIPVSSQMLVFSKTSVQKELISPRNPRALYFNDDAYIGYVPGSPALEVASVDPKLGTVYYVLLQKQKDKPRFFRNITQCMECHGGRSDDHIPVHLMRSIYPDKDGTPLEGAAEYPTTDASAFRERWGGWYVTGRHGNLRHMGNAIAQKHGDNILIDREKGANITNLRPLVDTSPYLSPYSDIVALMVMAHQTHIQNLITKVNYELGRACAEGPQTRVSLSRPKELGRARTEGTTPSAKDGHSPGSGVSRDRDLPEQGRSACEALVRAMLFVGEPRLTDAIFDASGFATQFATGGPRDRRNRSLRQLDLKRRLFRYPCSYTIYSEAFDALSRPARDYIYGRLWAVLRGQDPGPEFAPLSSADRGAIVEILLETKPDFAKASHGMRARALSRPVSSLRH